MNEIDSITIQHTKPDTLLVKIRTAFSTPDTGCTFAVEIPRTDAPLSELRQLAIAKLISELQASITAPN